MWEKLAAAVAAVRDTSHLKLAWLIPADVPVLFNESRSSA